MPGLLDGRIRSICFATHNLDIRTVVHAQPALATSELGAGSLNCNKLLNVLDWLEVSPKTSSLRFSEIKEARRNAGPSDG